MTKNIRSDCALTGSFVRELDFPQPFRGTQLTQRRKQDVVLLSLPVSIFNFSGQCTRDNQ